MTNKQFISDKDNLSCILADATYTTYWAKVSVNENDTLVKSIIESNANQCIEDDWAEILVKGGTIDVCDCEEGKTYTISIKAFEKGLNKLMRKYPRNYANIKEMWYDFFDVDMLLQLAVFGKVIYG